MQRFGSSQIHRSFYAVDHLLRQARSIGIVMNLVPISPIPVQIAPCFRSVLFSLFRGIIIFTWYWASTVNSVFILIVRFLPSVSIALSPVTPPPGMPEGNGSSVYIGEHLPFPLFHLLPASAANTDYSEENRWSLLVESFAMIFLHNFFSSWKLFLFSFLYKMELPVLRLYYLLQYFPLTTECRVYYLYSRYASALDCTREHSSDQLLLSNDKDGNARTEWWS